MLPDRSLQHLDLALAVQPLLGVLSGDKRDRLRRAFISSAEHIGLTTMPEAEGRLPIDAKTAALELHKAIIDLCMRAGLSRRDLTEHFNEHAEGASFGNGSIGEASERSLALLAIFHARKLTEPQT